MPSRNLLLEADKDNKKAAKIAKLKYIDNCNGGIERIRKGKNFKYYYKGKEITNEEKLQRIKKLAIPPSWSDVWICQTADGHIQATGMDLKQRKQYKYHESWNLLRSETKFHRLATFGKALPKLRKKIKKDLAPQELTENKVLAAVIRIMEETYIRIGSNGYEKLYGSYGLTTLKDNHVTIRKDKVLFSFKGKKKIAHEVILKNKKLAKIIRQCRDIPGKKLFQYYAEDKKKRKIDSGMVNRYIRDATGSDFSAKDFRTWAGSLKALESFRNMKDPSSAEEIKVNINLMIEEVSKKLGNTGNICKKYYIHPGLISLYEENKFFHCLDKCNFRQITSSSLTADEKLLIRILEKCV